MGKLNPKRYKPFVRSSSPFCRVHCAQWIGAHVNIHCVGALWWENGLSGLCEVKWHCDICTNHESTQPWLPPLDCWASVCQVGLPLSLSLSLHSAVRSSHSAAGSRSETPGERELRPGQWTRPRLHRHRHSLNRPPTTSRSCLGYLELLHHTRDRLTFLSIV